MGTITQLMDQREKEVTQQIEALRKQLAPLEAELAKIRVAKAAIKSENYEPVAPNFPRISAQLEFSPVLTAYRHLTMKQLTVKALKEQFPQGATANQLIAFFKNAWGRVDVRRSSLSPQLSRLQEDKIIKRQGRVWHLLESEKE